MFDTPAEAYDRFIGRYSAALAQELIAAAGVAPGMSALDVGCGPGALTSALVAVLGDAGAVCAVDPSPTFADACAARNPGVGVFLVDDGEELPFGDGAFDRALAQLVVNFMGDAVAGVREMARVTRDGGAVGVAVWDYAGEMVLLRAFWDAAAAVEPAALARDEGRAMAWCTPDELSSLLRAAGLCDISVSPAVVSASYEGFADLWAPLELGAGPAGAFTAALPAERRAALAGALRTRLGVGDEPFTLPARAWIAVGRCERLAA